MMNAKPGIRTACVQFADPEAPDGIDITIPSFLDACRRSAIARFHDPKDLRTAVQTFVHTQGTGPDSTGSIALHVHKQAFESWAAANPQGKRGVESELHGVLEDLAAQGLHGLIAFTEAQRALFVPDLEQAVLEALERTSFPSLARKARIHWEGSIVERVRPPTVTLVVSLTF